MVREIILTKDGSHTITLPELGVTYHSLHGAIQESMHVFIQAGLQDTRSRSSPLRIFEMGFGTGLNALLTFAETEKQQQPVHYTAIDLFPLEYEQTRLLNYCDQLERKDLQPVFDQLHASDWEKDIQVSPHFILHKSTAALNNFSSEPVHLIYYDAFAPSAQPELWSEIIFKKMYTMLFPGGILVTYCSKGDVRRAMQSSGFLVEKIPGPPGKREMVRAWKK